MKTWTDICELSSKHTHTQTFRTWTSHISVINQTNWIMWESDRIIVILTSPLDHTQCLMPIGKVAGMLNLFVFIFILSSIDHKYTHTNTNTLNLNQLKNDDNKINPYMRIEVNLTLFMDPSNRKTYTHFYLNIKKSKLTT